MRICLSLLCALLLSGIAQAAVPDWLQREVGAQIYTPGVYSLSQGRLLAVGAGRIAQSLRAERALRLAALRAENDAKLHLARHLFPNELKGQRRYTLALSGAQVAYSETRDGAVVLGLITQAASARLVPLPPLAECYDVRIAPLASQLLEESPPLAEGGAAIFPQKAVPSGWVAVGVGFAALTTGDDPAEEDKARILAAVDARRTLTEAIYGVTVSSSEKSSEILFSGPGGDLLRQWERNTVTENVRGLLQGAEIAGEWKTEDNHLAVLVLVGRPALQLVAEAAISQDNLPQFTMEEPWIPAFLKRPWLLTGGAALHVLDEQPFLLIVEKGRLQGNPTADRIQLPVLMETKARNAAARYLGGVETQSRAVDTEERHLDSAKAKEVLKSSLQKLAQENVLGIVQAMRKVGSWHSQDGKELFVAYITPLPH